MEMPYFVLNESLGETFIEEDNTPREEALVYVKKGVLNLTVCVISSGRNFMVGVEEKYALLSLTPATPSASSAARSAKKWRASTSSKA